MEWLTFHQPWIRLLVRISNVNCFISFFQQRCKLKPSIEGFVNMKQWINKLYEIKKDELISSITKKKKKKRKMNWFFFYIGILLHNIDSLKKLFILILVWWGSASVHLSFCDSGYLSVGGFDFPRSRVFQNKVDHGQTISWFLLGWCLWN